jgi:multiple sugar transport system permease protein
LGDVRCLLVTLNIRHTRPDQVFDTVYALTGGGPQGRTDLVAHRIYAEAFGAAPVGRAAVMAVVLFVLLVGVTIAQHLYFRRRISNDIT